MLTALRISAEISIIQSVQSKGCIAGSASHVRDDESRLALCKTWPLAALLPQVTADLWLCTVIQRLPHEAVPPDRNDGEEDPAF